VLQPTRVYPGIVWCKSSPLTPGSRQTLDDGQRNCPKHVEFYSKNKFEKLVHLVGFIIRICHSILIPCTSFFLLLLSLMTCIVVGYSDPKTSLVICLCSTSAVPDAVQSNGSLNFVVVTHDRECM